MKIIMTLFCLFVINLTNAQKKDILKISSTANLANSYILLDVLRAEYSADSLFSWINNGEQFTLFLKTNITGEILNDISIRSKAHHPVLKDEDKIKMILLKEKKQFVFPIEFIGDVDKKKGNQTC